MPPRGRSSVGRAPALHAGGRRFESARLHQEHPRQRMYSGLVDTDTVGLCHLHRNSVITCSRSTKLSASSRVGIGRAVVPERGDVKTAPRWKATGELHEERIGIGRARLPREAPIPYLSRLSHRSSLARAACSRCQSASSLVAPRVASSVSSNSAMISMASA
jgi:hypothetical protein